MNIRSLYRIPMVSRQSPDPARRSDRPYDRWGVALILCSALLVRIYPPMSAVFAGDRVVFQGNDAWYHMRLIDHLVANFPQRLTFDPYALFPGGLAIDIAPLFDLLVASSAWLLGFGSPSQRLVDVVAACYPPLLGVLTIALVIAIGRLLFDRWVGILAGAFLAVFPGQFLLRSRLGFTDHHVLETLLSTLTIWLLLRALTRVAPNPRPPGAKGPERYLSDSLWPGLALGAYLLTWSGGALFVAILILWSATRVIFDHLQDRSSTYLLRLLLPMVGVAFLTIAPFFGALARLEVHLAALALLALTPAGLCGMQTLFARSGLPRAVFLWTAIALALAGILLTDWLLPELTANILSFLGRWAPEPARLTVLEAKPMFFGVGTLDLGSFWSQYRLHFLLGALAWLLLVPGTLRQDRPGHLLFMVWSLGMLAATFGQNRFGYYLDVNLCLLLAWLCRRILGPLGSELGRQGMLVPRVLASTAMIALTVVPMLRPTIDLARQNTGPSPGWFEALDWLRRNTPEPLGTSGAYTELDPTPAEDGSFRYPQGAYGVLSWWDYGYWVLRIGRRIPNANPTQIGAREAAQFFTATDETQALSILEPLGTRYVLVNAERGSWQKAQGSGFVPVMAVWAERPSSRFVGLYWTPSPEGDLERKVLYHPDYYRSLFTRLYLYGGRGWTPQGASWVISFEEREVPGNGTGRVITDTLFFDSHQAAVTFLATREDRDRWRLVSPDPLLSCVPLEPLKRLRQVHETSASVAATGSLRLPEIRIFEVLPEAP